MGKFSRQAIALAMGVSAILCSLHLQAQESAEARLDELLANVETLSAEVLQLIVEADGGVLEESEIQMYLKRPNGFYWETLSPFPELIVTDGATLWNYQPDLEQVVIEDWDSNRSELAAQLLSGETARLKLEYQIDKQDNEDSTLDDFSLQPLAGDSIYSVITISFAAGQLLSIHLDHKNGQQTVWQFSQVIRNQELDASRFEFQLPNDIEVVDNRGV